MSCVGSGRVWRSLWPCGQKLTRPAGAGNGLYPSSLRRRGAVVVRSDLVASLLGLVGGCWPIFSAFSSGLNSDRPSETAENPARQIVSHSGGCFGSAWSIRAPSRPSQLATIQGRRLGCHLIENPGHQLGTITRAPSGQAPAAASSWSSRAGQPGAAGPAPVARSLPGARPGGQRLERPGVRPCSTRVQLVLHFKSIRLPSWWPFQLACLLVFARFAARPAMSASCSLRWPAGLAAPPW